MAGKETNSVVARHGLDEGTTINGSKFESTKKQVSCLVEPEAFWLSHVFVPICYVLIFLVGVVGNGLVIYLMIKKDRRGTSGYQRSVTNIYVLNLAIADLIFVGFLPFWIANSISENNWLFGDVGCKVLTFITLLNLYGSVFFLVGMGIDRYFAIVLALKAHSRRTRKGAINVCVAIWIMAFVVASQAFFLRKTSLVSEKPCPKRYVCHWDFYGNPSLQTAYSVIRTVLGFFLPFAIMLFCYFFIFLSLKKRNHQTAQSGMRIPEQKITRLILWVIGMFMLCWLPNQILNVIYALTNNSHDQEYAKLIRQAFSFTSCPAYANSSFNPILYAFMKDDIRTQLASLAAKYFGYRRTSTGGEILEASSPRFTVDTREMTLCKKSSSKYHADRSKSSDDLSSPATLQNILDNTNGTSGEIFDNEDRRISTDDFDGEAKSLMITTAGAEIVEKQGNYSVDII